MKTTSPLQDYSPKSVDSLRSSAAYLVSQIQNKEIQPDQLINFRILENGNVITLAPDGRKYKFSQAEIDEIAIKSLARRTIQAKSVAVSSSIVQKPKAKKPARDTGTLDTRRSGALQPEGTRPKKK